MAGETDSFDPNAYEFDPRPEVDDNTITSRNERVAVIRTSDRILYKRCRRRWGWNSHLRGNLGPKEGQTPLWMGSGFHFALEDFHGLKRFPSAKAAFDGYVDATRRHNAAGLPADWQDAWELATGMLTYYEEHWLRNRDPLKTFVYNGVPQLEVNFRVEIPWETGRYGYDRVVYSGTLDRVAEDEMGQLWIVEYKTAKSIQTLHLANDSQVSSYCWAGYYLYGRPIAGVIYQQHRKDVPKEPKILASGKLSTDKRQLITSSSFRSYLINLYGDIKRTPSEYVDMLNYFTALETPDKDMFVQRNRIERNRHQAEAEGEKILMEVEEMLNPDLSLYPNPTRDCQFMCPFNGTCVSMDDGSDWEYELALMTQPREPVYDSWRTKIRWPDESSDFTFTG